MWSEIFMKNWSTLNLKTVSFEINAAMRSMNAESRVIHICDFPAVEERDK